MTDLLLAENLALPGRLAPTTLRLSAGELVCVIGPNGGGKTSLLHALAGIGSPTGTISISGVDPSRAGPGRRSQLLSFLPAGREVYWPLLARDLIGLGGAGAREQAWIIDRLDLDEFADRRIDRLSTGERSRVMIARALAARSRLLLLDEPTANLDPLWQIRLMEILKGSLLTGGQTALIAMHDLDAAGRYADRILVMLDGQLIADGDPQSILHSPVISQAFGIHKVDGEWQPLRTADRISSP